jgi:transcription elongation GreA/GreB family factor
VSPDNPQNAHSRTDRRAWVKWALAGVAEGVVGIGSRVRIRMSSRERVIDVVGHDEADPAGTGSPSRRRSPRR